MDIVACVKLVYDETQIPLSGDQLLIEEAPVKISDMDKNALEEAVRIKEEKGGTVTVVLVVTGPFDETILKEALAMGADRALIIEGDELVGHNPFRTAQAIAKAIKEKGIGYDLILCGEGSSDQYSCAMPAMLAEMLSLPVATFVGSMEVGEDNVIVERYLEGGFERLEIPLPAIISVTSEVNEPRIPTVIQIMRAGKKEKINVSASELNLSYPQVELVEIKALIKERKREKLEGDPSEVAKKIADILAEKGVI